MSATLSADDSRARILDAAMLQLRRFGPEKLTVQDIAREAGMSHPNLYRFFPSKAAILDAVVGHWLGEIERPLRPLLDADGSAASRIERFILDHHRIKAAKVTQESELFRAYGSLLDRAAPDAIRRHIATICELLAELVRQGVAAGEFADDVDPITAARLLREATLSFHHPSLLPKTLEEVGCELRLRDMARLLLNGLSSRQS